jgi:hypothetical protein
MPQAWENPDLYGERVRKQYKVSEHAIGKDTVHGITRKIFKPTLAQVQSAVALVWGFCELFPSVNPEFPKDKAGQIVKTNIANPEHHNGFLAHFHITQAKIDPLGFPFGKVEEQVAARRKLGY